MTRAVPPRSHRRAALTLIMILITTVIGIGLAGCGSDSSTSSSQTGIERIRDSGVLRVGTEGTYPPFSYHDSGGKLVGFDVEVAEAVGAQLGVRVEFVETPWDSIFAALGANRFDVVANQVTVTPERAAKYDLSVPYTVGEGVIVTRADDDSIHSLGDLRGKTVAGTITSNWAQIAKGAGANVEGVDGFAAAVKLLDQGRVDAIVNDSVSVHAYIAKEGDSSVKIAAKTGGRAEQAFAATKDSGIIPEVDKALATLKADGTLSKLSQKYLRTDVTPGEDSADGAQSTWHLIADNLWPMAKAALTVTIPLAAVSFVIGLIIALAVALARLSSNRIVSWVARAYVSVIRGTPLLVQLFIIFFALPEAGIEIAPFPAAIAAFSLNVGGYAAEIIRSAILSVPKGQTEAAQTIGMGYATTMRRIILPQAARNAVPGLSNTLISLVKDTSLASTILVTELFRTAQIAAAPTFEFFALYATAAAYYWIICVVLSGLQGRLEKRLGRFVKT